MKTAPALGEIAALRGEYAPAGAAQEYRSRDGKRLLQVELHAQGLRDLHAAVLRMAQQVSREPRLARAILAVWSPRISDDRLRGEWGSTLGLFKPSIAARMALVVVRPDHLVAPDEDREVRRIGEALRTELGGKAAPVPVAKPGLSRTFFEIFKILLHRWLLQQGPIPVGELMRQAACSYPSAADAIRRLEAAEEIVRRSNRSVQLPRFPQKTWSEVLALSETLRRTQYFADGSGRAPDPQGLLKRLQSAADPRIGLGGVPAARHWDPHFDLNGMPRLDLCLHRPGGLEDPGLLQRLDPALQPVKAGTKNIVLAIHPLLRKEPLFTKSTKGKVGWADPVETLFDLHELRLVDQAEALVRRLSERKS